MPLLKKKPHKLQEPPKNLEPRELVYQVRLTKEIFRDYQLYLKRINLYRTRVWTCKCTGKTSLTYEEALESEKQASKKVQTLPKELVAPALRIIQFSALSLKDLADLIAAELQNCFFVGAELYGKRDGEEVHPCKILEIVTDRVHGDSRPQYEVGFFDKDKEIEENALLFGDDLSWKKFPFSRNFLKSFIRDSTCQSIPWVVSESLAKAHGISKKIPKELRDKYVFRNGELVQQRKQDKGKRKREENGEHVEEETKREVKQSEEEPKLVTYPIEDLLLLRDADIAQRPCPSRDFSVSVDCVGDLLMVWDFCTSFGRQLHLSPFSLEDFENALCHKESNLNLIMEVHACLFRFLINEGSDNFKALRKRSRKSKITMSTWTEYLCDFLESVDTCFDIGTIKRGHYGPLEPNVKLKILRELVNHITETSMFKAEIDGLVEQQHSLGAARREEALMEARQIREEKERSKTGEEANGVLDNSKLEKKKTSPQVSESSEDSKEKENSAGEIKVENGFVSSGKNEKPEKRLVGNVYLRKHKRKMTDTIIKQEEEEDEEEEEEEEEKEFPGKKQGVKSASEDEIGPSERRGPKQRRQHYEREMEKIVIRTNPLGKDRDYNRYWWFRSNGRIFVENSDSKEWGYYASKEELDSLMGSLNRKGERELSLHTQLEKFYDKICSTLQKRTKDITRNIEMEEAVVRRSTRVKATIHENPAFSRYVNKWKED